MLTDLILHTAYYFSRYRPIRLHHSITGRPIYLKTYFHLSLKLSYLLLPYYRKTVASKK